jgi:hypothetical protein
MDTLIISCCAAKLEHSAPAFELYQNRVFKLLRNTEDLQERFEIYILSAKYGLIPGYHPIAPYDQRMDRARASELTARPEAPLWLRSSPGDVYVYGGELYREVVRSWMLQMEGFKLADPSRQLIELIGKNRGNGDHFSALKEATA